jgi:gamma-glutamylcyclotransferase (GGCT)/AIG2-like uncharacterized protein YtfP
MKRYYFAYGMNTNLREMALRCPNATCLGYVVLRDHKFAFRLHADVEYSEGSSVDGVLWEITEQCEDALDRLEGYPYYYDKKGVVVETPSGTNIKGMTRLLAMVYFMNDQDTVGFPSQSYYNCLIEGYTANGVPTDQIDEAMNDVNEKAQYT